MGKWLGLLVLLALALVGWRVYLILDKSGSFRHLEFVQEPACRAITGAIGPEDLAIDHASGFVYVSSFDRRRFNGGDKTVRGMIAAFSLGPSNGTVVDLTSASESGAPRAFQPHGLSLYVGADGKETLAVVNHGDGDSIELFDVSKGSEAAIGWTPPVLTHRRTVKDPLFRSLNDVALIGPDQFYVTNDHYYPPGFMRQIEDYLLLRKTDVVYFDGENAHVAVKHLTYANGIAVSADGRSIYVAETTQNDVRVYTRDPATNDLKFADRIDVHTGVDNIDVAPDGSLYIGAHAKLFALVKLLKEPNALSPSEVVHLTKADKGWTRRTVFIDDGERISGLSVAARHEDKLVLGSIMGKDILVCPLTE